MPGTNGVSVPQYWPWTTNTSSSAAQAIAREGQVVPVGMLVSSCNAGKASCSVDGYKASFELGLTEIGCMAHARRKFFELHATNKNKLAEQALRYIHMLYEIEREVRDLEPDLRRRIGQEKAVPEMDMLHA